MTFSFAQTGARCAWAAADWGTSNLRVWLMDAGGSVIEARAAPSGMGVTAPGAFEETFVALIADQLAGRAAPLPAVCCGMAGARQGWAEAPYRAAPCAPISAVAAGRRRPLEVIKPAGRISVTPRGADRERGVGDRARRSRAAELVVDDGERVARFGETKHGFDEILPVCGIDPRRSHHDRARMPF